jgi:hypothetical protein
MPSRQIFVATTLAPLLPHNWLILLDSAHFRHELFTFPHTVFSGCIFTVSQYVLMMEIGPLCALCRNQRPASLFFKDRLCCG